MSSAFQIDEPTPTRRWGDEWMEMVAHTPALVRRMGRGRAGSGRAVDALRIEPGSVRIRVSDGRGRSHDVKFTVPVFTDEQRAAAVEELADELRWTADILDGILPAPLGDGFVLPVDIDIHCTCSDTFPCRHVAQTQHALQLAFNRDAYRLLRLRGWERDDVMRELRAARGTTGGSSEEEELDLSEPTTARGDLGAIDVHPVPTPEVERIFEELGPPPGFEDSYVIEEQMRGAASLAWKLAAGEGADVADDEALVTELRGQGIASAGSVASALGLDSDLVQETLDRLYSAGTVMRMGEGETARYRAA